MRRPHSPRAPLLGTAKTPERIRLFLSGVQDDATVSYLLKQELVFLFLGGTQDDATVSYLLKQEFVLLVLSGAQEGGV